MSDDILLIDGLRHVCYYCGRDFHTSDGLRRHQLRHAKGWTNPYPDGKVIT